MESDNDTEQMRCHLLLTKSGGLERKTFPKLKRELYIEFYDTLRSPMRPWGKNISSILWWNPETEWLLQGAQEARLHTPGLLLSSWPFMYKIVEYMCMYICVFYTSVSYMHIFM